MEEQILRYYLKAFSITFIIIIILFCIYIFYLLNKNIVVKNNPIIIHKKNFKGDKKFIINRFNNYFKDQIKEYIKFEIINYHNSKIKRYD